MQQSPEDQLNQPLESGLNDAQVQQRRSQGLNNQIELPPTRSIGRILKDNLLTLFNLIHVILAIVVFSVGAYRNALFMGVVISNAVVGIFQELRAKKVLDRLHVLVQPGADVMRNGTAVHIAAHELVVDDIVMLGLGNQVLCDGSIITSRGLEVDESLLTGEAEPVFKRPGDKVYSGSFIVSGQGSMRITEVGQKSYACGLAAQARKPKKTPSELMDAIKWIVSFLSIIIVPVGLLLFFTKVNLQGELVQHAVVGTVAGIIGMIPEGLVLLTSVSLAVGAMKLAQRRMLVQTLPCIETLARVDMLCLDKTGTITQPDIQVVRMKPLTDATGEEQQAAAAIANSLPGDNATQTAMKNFFGISSDWVAEQTHAFSSARKWSGACFSGRGSWVLGAAEFIMPSKLPEELATYTKQGLRVLLLAHSDSPFPKAGELPPNLSARALILMENAIREDAPETLAYFAKQGVDIKVISGDNAQAVSSVALRAGLNGAQRYIDLSTVGEGADYSKLACEYTVFGRVSPEQKMNLISAMKKNGHTVGMIGDGVNDVLALREADCSIAMAGGSDAARSIANLVLLDNNFSVLVQGVSEGRRVINNIGRVATMFLVKMVYSLILSVLYILMPYPYPLLPIQMTLISTLAKGIPSLFLALEPNEQKVSAGFLRQVVQGSLPAGIAAVIGVMLIQHLGVSAGLDTPQINTLCTFAMGVISFIVLFEVSKPWSLPKGLIYTMMLLGFIGAFMVAPQVFQLLRPVPSSLWLYVTIAGLCILLERLCLAAFKVVSGAAAKGV